ncbi:hypothetical protein BC936DRAFT_147813, partial [Jimgerdemannia flammicorona]
MSPTSFLKRLRKQRLHSLTLHTVRLLCVYLRLATSHRFKDRRVTETLLRLSLPGVVVIRDNGSIHKSSEIHLPFGTDPDVGEMRYFSSSGVATDLPHVTLVSIKGHGGSNDGEKFGLRTGMLHE